jgi:hypothetical protein
LKRLAILAEICRHKLDDYQMEIYDRELRDRGYAALSKAVDRLMVTRKSNSPFPSIAELKNLVPSVVTENVPRGTCGACKDGLIYAVPTDNPKAAHYVFKCECNIGTMRPENLPRWADAASGYIGVP